MAFAKVRARLGNRVKSGKAWIVNHRRATKIGTAISLVLILLVGISMMVTPWWKQVTRNTYIAYFPNTNGVYTGDEIRILGVAVGTIEKIEPQPNAAKVTFTVESEYPVPADVRAAILSPSLVTSRAIQLVPVYSGGPKLADGATIPEERTAVPVEWDDLRKQLEKLTESLQPTTEGGTSALGQFVNTSAANLRGEGDTARDTVIKLSQAVSALGDHSTDIFSTLRNLETFVSALTSSSELLASFNKNLANITTVMTNTPNEWGQAIAGLDGAVNDLRPFVAENREAIGTTFDHLNEITTALNDSRRDIKQTLHVAPNVFQNFLNIYQPAQSAVTGILALSNFADTVQSICGSIESDGRVGAKTVGATVRAVSVSDHQKPPVQLPADRSQPIRGCIGTSQRDHLQRGQAQPAHTAAGSAGRPAPRGRSPPPTSPQALPGGAVPPAPAAVHSTDPHAGTAGLDGAGGRTGAARRHTVRRTLSAALAISCLCLLTSCGGWRGLNSLPLPGTQGKGDGAYTIQAQLPDVVVIQPNTRVRVADVNIGNVTKIEVQDWHALVTMRINGDVHLPANSTAKVGQTSLLGSMHIELAPPTDEAPKGQLKNGSVIPLSRAATYPTTEQTLASVAILLNGGGLGHLQEITRTFATALTGREKEMRSLLTQLDIFVTETKKQTDDIITAIDSLNSLVGQVADKDPAVDKALTTIPQALGVLSDTRKTLVDAIDKVGQFSAVAASTINQTKKSLVDNFRNLAPALRELANAGPALTRGLDFLSTLPWVKSTVPNWFRGDFANISLIVDLTLSRLDSGFFTGSKWEGNLTELEMQWGRTIGQMPSPYTAVNPLIAAYHWGGY